MRPSVPPIVRSRSTDGLPRSAIAVASFGAAATHAAVAGTHLEEWGPAGALFLVAAAAQWTVGLVVLAVSSKKLEVAAAAGNAALIAVWATSRTVGLPLGYEPWTAERVGAADALAVVLEAAVVIGAIMARKREASTLRNPVAVIVATAAVTLVGIALASAHHGTAHALVHVAGVTAAAAAFAAYVAWEVGTNGVPRLSLRLRP